MSLVCTMLFALTAYDIFDASHEELLDMAALRGIDTSLSDDAIRTRLYESENLEHYEAREENLSDSYTVEILSTDSLYSSGGITTLRGNVSLRFSFKNNDSTLSSDTVIIDSNRKLLSAIGNVTFLDGDNTINADIVTFYWEKGELNVERASTSSEKTLDSSSTPITVYSVGEKLTFLDNGSVIYEDGYIASREKDPLSAIQATDIMMLPGSDMLIENAILKIGRVPVFYFPAFFYPGSVINGNPAFGFTSEKGAFLNTTFEFLGHTDRIQSSEDSSFLAIFDNSDVDRSTLVPNGAFYSQEEPEGLQKWAFDTDSHIAMMADAYSALGVHLGIDLALNFLDGKLGIESLAGFGYTRSNDTNIPSPWRYYGENTFSYSDFGLDIDIEMPFYSDPAVMNDLGNRLTTFSIDPLFGQRTTFPDTYNSTLSSYSREISISYDLPGKYQTKYLDDLSLSTLRYRSRHSWSSNDKRYLVEELLLPVIDLSLSGALFDEEMTKKKADVVEEKTSEQDRYLLSDPLLYPLFQSDIRPRGAETIEEYTASMRYNFDESLENQYDYTHEKNDGGYFSSESEFNLEFLLNAGSYLQLSDTVTPYFDYQSEWDENYRSEDKVFRFTNALDLKIPYIGLEYKLTNRLYTWSDLYENGTREVSESKLDFNEESVLVHSIGLTKAFNTEVGTFTPSISYTLFPLVGSLQPSLSYRYGGFALALSYRMEENDSTRKLETDLAALSIAYDSTYFTTNWRFEYDTSELLTSSDWIRPLDISGQIGVRTSDKKWALTGRLDYESYSEDESSSFYFNEITGILTLPMTDISVSFDGSANELALRSVDLKFDMENQVFQFWKGRIYISLGLNLELHFDVKNISSSYFIFEPDITFSIAEFMDLKFAFRSVNNNFMDYGSEVDGAFLMEMLNDLWQSFDIIGGGNRQTNFNMESVSIEFVHYMADWDLHVKYTASVLLSNGRYRFVPEFAVYLSWKTFPDLKVDQAWEDNGSGVWQRGESDF